MPYPQTIPAVGDKLNAVAYAADSPLSSQTQEALIVAAGKPNIVEKLHPTIAALAPVFEADGENMDQDARELLAGACRLCNEHSWSPRGGLNYANILAGVAATLPANDPAPEPEEEPEPEPAQE